MKKSTQKERLHFNLLNGYVLFVFILCLNSKIVLSQEFPTHFPWITDTVYISGGANEGGNGSLSAPYNSWDDFSFKSKTAYLFERGDSMKIDNIVNINPDSVFLGGYGSGERPLFTGTGHQLRFYGSQQYIQGINIAITDTAGTSLIFRGSSDKFAWADNMELSGGYKGIEPSGYENIILSNLHVHNIHCDGIYASSNDTITFKNCWVEDVNRRYLLWPNPVTSGGDCIQLQTAGFVNVIGCYLDRSDMPGKFALILNGVDTAYCKNSTFISHDESTAVFNGGSAKGFHYEGCKIIGGEYGFLNSAKLVVKNCIFKGQWHNAIRGPVGDICNNVFADTYGDRYNLCNSLNVSGDNTILNIYNNNFYNVKQAYNLKKEFIGVTIMISNNNYFNDHPIFEGKANKTPSGSNVTQLDPLFDFSIGDSTDYYLSSNSPMIDAGFDLSEVGISLTSDINGVTRPMGAGYDIGAYEHFQDYVTALENNSLSENDIIIYPNPFQEELIVESETENIQQIEIYSFIGKKIVDVKVSNLLKYNLNLTGLKSGSYIVRVIMGESTYSQKIVKE